MCWEVRGVPEMLCDVCSRYSVNVGGTWAGDDVFGDVIQLKAERRVAVGGMNMLNARRRPRARCPRSRLRRTEASGNTVNLDMVYVVESKSVVECET